MISAQGGEHPATLAGLSVQLAEAEETLRAIRAGEVDALVVPDGSPGEQVFTLSSADRPYRMFVETMCDGAATVSEDGIILYANRRMAELLSQPLSGIIGAALAGFVAESDHAALSAQTGRAASEEKIEIALVGSDGLPVPVRVGASTLEVDSVRLACLTFADLTALNREQDQMADAHRKAIEASRLKSEFVANMSHEIRTPLSGVIGMSGLLLDTPLSEEQREYADGVRSSGAALMAVVDDILDFSKIDVGKLEIEEAPFALLALVEEVCSEVAAPAHAKGVELLSWVEGDLPAIVSGDSTRVRQVLTNLMSNAVKFTATGEVVAQVSRASQDGGSSIRFEVTDTGIGIPTASADRIFESFAQADGSTTREYGGTGLGLTISKQLVGLMGGEIGVASVEDEGSSFWFTLPLPAAADDSSEPERSGLAGIRVLAVDDNDTSRSLLERQLTAWDMPCETANDGDAALGMLDAADDAGLKYGLVLLDDGMPGMTGTELAEAIRSRSSARRVPILMLTSAQSGREAGTNAGVDGFVTKPVQQARLHEGMAQVLDLVRSEERADPDEPSSGGRDHDGGRVLLAEDNEINQLVATRMLEKHGFQVDLAVNGREALEMCRRRRYQAIFMDCHMPELDGYEATAEIRRREGSGRHLPIIAMTANTIKGDRERCLAAGMDDYIAKPVDPNALRLAISRSIDGDTRQG